MCRVKETAMLALAAAGLVFAQTPLWQNLYPAYNGLAFGGGKFAAVSGDGVIRVTGDGEGWTQAFPQLNGKPIGNPIVTVAYGDGRFIALPHNLNNYLISADGGGYWTAGSSNSRSYYWKKLAFGEFLDGWGFGAVAEDGETALFFNEEDGWINGDADEDMSHIAFGNTRAVVVGKGIKSSVNEKGWGSTNISSSTQVAVVAFSGEKFVALAKNGSNVYTSSNGTAWETASASAAPNMADMVYGGGKFVAVGAAGKGCVSGDGASWTVFTLNEADDFKAVSYGNDAFLALGAKGSVYKSANGTTWEKKAGHSVNPYKQIVYGGGKYVAVGDSGVSVSADGLNWVRNDKEKNALASVAFGADRFVAVGNGGSVISAAAANVDGAWDNQSENFGGEVFTSVAFGGGVFIAGGREGGGKAAPLSRAIVYTSANGQDWADKTYDVSGWPTSGQHIVSLCFGNGQFLAAVNGTKTLKRCEGAGRDIGQYWSEVSGLPGETDGYEMTSATFANNRFTVVGTKRTGESVIVGSASADAPAWTAVPVPEDIKWVKSAIYAKSTYIAVADSGNIYAQIGGVWKPQPKATNRNLATIYYSEDKNALLAAGAGGAMLYSVGEPVSVRHASAPRSAARSGGTMSLERSRRAFAVTLSFAPSAAGTISVYSLDGRRIYRTAVGIGERFIRLPERAMRNGSVFVRYSGGGRVVSQRFQAVR